MKSPFKRRNIIRHIAALIAFAAFGTALVTGPARADEADIEKAPASNIAPIRLPEGALRSLDEASMTQFGDALKEVVGNKHGAPGKIKALIWKAGKAGTAAMKELPACLKEAGYTYSARDTFETEGAKVTPITASRKDKKGDLLGMWIEKEGLILLVWGQFKAENGQPAGGDAPAKPTSPAKEKASAMATQTARSEGGRVPADVVGKWSWTTISSVNYQNTTTGQLTEPSGMSAKFTFSKDGRYTKFFYIHQRTYSLVTESTTTEEGTVNFNDDGTFLVKPVKGYYKGHTGSRLIDRPMTDAERKPTTWFYEWRTVNGKRQLYIGPAKGSLSPFKAE
jgi:hypothetical protein